MSVQQRRWLSWLFIILFFVITPLTLSYATGYQINWRNLRLERTGLLEIKTEPTGALINIDEIRAWPGRSANFIAPVKIKNLRPDHYHVHLSLAGYHDWQKVLAVRPAETTFAKNIRLFKKSQPRQLLALPDDFDLTTANLNKSSLAFNLTTKQLTTSTITSLLDQEDLENSWFDYHTAQLACPMDSQKIAYTNHFELWLADLNQKTTTLLGRFSQPIDQLICLPDNANYLIFGHQQGWQLIELDSREGHSLWSLATTEKLGQSAINKKANRLYFYGQIDGSIGLFSLDL